MSQYIQTYGLSSSRITHTLSRHCFKTIPIKDYTTQHKISKRNKWYAWSKPKATMELFKFREKSDTEQIGNHRVNK